MSQINLNFKFLKTSNFTMTKSSTIQFLHNNRLVEIDFSKETEHTPTTTVLQYLRKSHQHKGTKEGCAEGDCGACTVNLAEISNNELKYTAVNSCLLFLPTLHAKQLITIENLGTSNDLHDIQKAMLQTDASQCGYCTPGFAMSMLPLFKQKSIPKKEEIQLALAGNLCRCTGYRPILDAAMQIAGKNSPDKFTENEQLVIQELNKIHEQTNLIEIQNNSTVYFMPQNLNEALRLRNEKPNAILISGSSDIALKVTKKYEHLNEIIDLSHLNELNFIEKTKKTVLIGSGTTLETIKDQLSDIFPALREMLTVFGSRQIRNVATLGGNIGSASPIGDSLPILMAYNAIVHLQSAEGKRQIAIREFITDYRKTQIATNELIVTIEIPVTEKKKIIKYYKISKRKDLDISTVSAAFELELDKASNVLVFNAFYGGMAHKTSHASNVEQFLVGKKWNEEHINLAKALVKEDFKPISDARSGAEARLLMAENLLFKFYLETIN